jgi:hypothetical protein
MADEGFPGVVTAYVRQLVLYVVTRTDHISGNAGVLKTTIRATATEKVGRSLELLKALN